MSHSLSTILADAQTAKCNAFLLDSEIAALYEWGIDCKIDNKEEEREELGRLIWLAESGCLDEDGICKVGKRLNKFNLIAITCDDIEEVICNTTIPCSSITITISNEDDCDLPLNTTISVE